MSLATLFFGEIPVMVAASLRAEPEAWKRAGDYRLIHTSGLGVWIGNGSYGMDVDCGHEILWGDVTVLSTFNLSPGHRLLRCAADNWLRPRKSENAPRVRRLLSGGGLP